MGAVDASAAPPPAVVVRRARPLDDERSLAWRVRPPGSPRSTPAPPHAPTTASLSTRGDDSAERAHGGATPAAPTRCRLQPRRVRLERAVGCADGDAEPVWGGEPGGWRVARRDGARPAAAALRHADAAGLPQEPTRAHLLRLPAPTRAHRAARRRRPLRQAARGRVQLGQTDLSLCTHFRFSADRRLPVDTHHPPPPQSNTLAVAASFRLN